MQFDIHVAPSEAESVVHTKAKNLPSLQISRGVDTQPSPERGSYAYSDWNINNNYSIKLIMYSWQY